MAISRAVLGVLALSWFFCGDLAMGAEGMWLPSQVPALASELRAMGFEGDPAAFANLTGQPMGAIVWLGGCSASFVSPDGLIVTNHHCAARAIQYNSTPSQNLWETGFIASDRTEELPSGPGARVWIAESFDDVTDAVAGDRGRGLSGLAYYERTESRIKQLVAACEDESHRCFIRAFDDGLSYFRIRYFEIRDLRLAYAPAKGIGLFGGDTDNFRWPRHTGDWSFFRAYVGPDGKPASYAKENRPYHPQHWLTVSRKGVEPGELVFVVGYPGSTRRHRSYAELREMINETVPRRIRKTEQTLEILDRLAAKNEDLALKVAGWVGGLSNGLIYHRGVLAGMGKGGVLERRRVMEKELAVWIAANVARAKKYHGVLKDIEAVISAARQGRSREEALSGLYDGSKLLSAAQKAYRLSIERSKVDAEREIGFQKRDEEHLLQHQRRSQRFLDAGIDRAVFRHALHEAVSLAKEDRIVALDAVLGIDVDTAPPEVADAIDSYLDGYYKGTKLMGLDERLKLFASARVKIEESADPAVHLAVLLYPLFNEIHQARKARAGELAKLRPHYIEALREKSGGRLYSDANGTLRVTYGRVQGVPAADGIYFTPQTTLTGMLAKNSGSGEFAVPSTLLAAAAALRAGKRTPYLDPNLDDLPVNFLSSVDTTGGNSGSATLNARGELCGLLFDGTFESMTADDLYNSRMTRSIHVDSRFMLWVMSEVDHAVALLEELGVKETTHRAGS